MASENFLETLLQTAETMLDIAATENELKDHRGARLAVQKAHTALDQVEHLSTAVSSIPESEALAARIHSVRQRLEQFDRDFPPEGAPQTEPQLPKRRRAR